MLSISPPISGARAGNYYTALNRDDYYTSQDSQKGEWLGEGAAKLGLKGRVEPDDFASLLKGFLPMTDEPLVQNAGKSDRQSGWDLTFSAPKSVSVYWALGSDDVRKEIEEALRAAVSAAVKFIEQECAFTRRGNGGREVEPTKLVAAAFEHSTSRALDPQLHIHVVVVNVAPRRDGTTGTLVSQPIFDAKMTAGALFRAELATQLVARLGVELKNTKHGFELAAVPEEICSVFSKRSQAIAARAMDGDTAETKKRITLATRPAKVQVEREELFYRWAQEAKANGFDAQRLDPKKPNGFSFNERKAFAEQSRTAAQSNERKDLSRTFSITPTAKRVVLKLLADIAKKGGFVTALKERKAFKRAPAWSPISRITQSKLFVGRYPWGNTHWSVTLLPGKLRLTVRDRWLFPAAPTWNPVSKLKLRAFRFEPPPPPRPHKRTDHEQSQSP